VLAWIGNLWNVIARMLGRDLHMTARMQIAIGDLLLAAAGAVAVAVVVRLLRSMTLESASVAGGIEQPLLAAEALYARGHAAARAGLYRDAISLLFRAALSTLDVRGVLRAEPSLTVRDGRAAVRQRAPQLISAYDTLSGIFTAAFYAEDPAGPDQWSAASEAYFALAGRPPVAL
jgi:hypothetical protein